MYYDTIFPMTTTMVAERFIIRNIIKTKNKGGTSLIQFLNLYRFFGFLFRKGIPFALTSYTL